MAALGVERLSVAHDEVDAEIDPDADEQHGESHRDQVELADRQGGEACGQHQTDREGDHGVDDQEQRAHTPDQQQGHGGSAENSRDRGAGADTLQFLLVQRRLAGHTEPEAGVGVDADRAGVRAHRLDRGRGHGQRVRIEARLGDHQLPARRGQIAALQRLAPGELARPVGELRLDRSSHGPKQPIELSWKRTSRPRLPQRELGHGGKATQVWRLGQHRQQGLASRQPIGQVGKLVGLEVEETMSCEERIAGLILHCGEMLIVGAQRRGQSRGCFLDPFRRGTFDHRDDRVLELGELPDEGGVVAPEGDIGRNHVLGPGVDAEVRQGIA